MPWASEHPSVDAWRDGNFFVHMAGRHVKPRERHPALRVIGLAIGVSSLAVAATTTYGIAPIHVAAQPIIGSGLPAVIRKNVAPAVDVLPAFVRVRSIGVTSPLVQLGLELDGSLEVPVDFATAGWYSGGPVPGANGPSVIAGHIDSYTGPAIFAKLSQVTPGDIIDITRTDGLRVTFEVDRIDQYPKAYFPTDLVYGPTSKPELRLITCGGIFNEKAGSYQDNVVVYAHLVEASHVPRPSEG